MGQQDLPPVSVSPAEAGELEAPKSQSSLTFKERVGAVVASGAAVAVLLWAGVRTAEYLDYSSTPVANGDRIGRLDYAPAGELDDSSPTLAATEKTMTQSYYADGHETGLLKPTDKTRQFYRRTFSNPQVGISKHIPKLTEVAHMQDKNIFKPEYEDQLYTYPVTILNNTEQPIDLMYLNYAIRATKSWLGEEVEDDDGFEIGGHTLVHTAARGIPHTIVMTSKLPPELHKKLPYSDGITKWYDDHTASFIKESGPEPDPFVPWLIGTEVCQALIKVSGASPVPGHKDEEKDVQRFIATFNSGAANNLNLAEQEEFCNSMGREEAAAYFGGRAAVAKLPAEAGRVGQSRTPWLDYRPFEPQVGDFIRIARRIKNGGSISTLIMPRGDDSPTARFYREKDYDTAG